MGAKKNGVAKAASTFSLLEQVSRLEHEVSQLRPFVQFVQANGYPPEAMRADVAFILDDPESTGKLKERSHLAENVIAWVSEWVAKTTPRQGADASNDTQEV